MQSRNGLPIVPLRFLRPRNRNGTIGNPFRDRSEEHTSELQSQSNLVCRLLVVKNNRGPHSSILKDLVIVHSVNIIRSIECVQVMMRPKPYQSAVTIKHLILPTLDSIRYTLRLI